MHKFHKIKVPKSLADNTALGGLAAVEPLCFAEFAARTPRTDSNYFWGSFAAAKILLAERASNLTPQAAGEAQSEAQIPLIKEKVPLSGDLLFD